MAKQRLQNTALGVTRWVGSVPSVVVHTLLFAGSFLAVLFNVLSFDRMLLILTTLVSLEAIYLAIFIQMTINAQQASLEEVEADIDEIQEDIDEIQEDVEEISEDTHEDEVRDVKEAQTLEQIHAGLQKLMNDVERLARERATAEGMQQK